MYLLSPRLKEKYSHCHSRPTTWLFVYHVAAGELGMNLVTVELIWERRAVILLSARRVVPHEAGVVFRLHTVKLQVQPLPVGSVVPPGICQDPVQGHDVAEGHLQSLILGQLLVLAPLRDDFTQPVEGCVQTLHPLPLPGVSSHPPPGCSLVFLWALGVWFGGGLGPRVAAAGSARLHDALLEDQNRCVLRSDGSCSVCRVWGLQRSLRMLQPGWCPSPVCVCLLSFVSPESGKSGEHKGSKVSVVLQTVRQQLL